MTIHSLSKHLSIESHLSSTVPGVDTQTNEIGVFLGQGLAHFGHWPDPVYHLFYIGCGHPVTLLLQVSLVCGCLLATAAGESLCGLLAPPS